MEFYNKTTIKNTNIKYVDIYFTPEYGKACELSDKAEWELCKYKDLIYVYLKRPIVYLDNIYYDLITPYGYSGYYYEKKETYNDFIPLFREKAKDRNYVTEVLRQNPYLNIDILKYNIILSRKLYGINLENLNKDSYLINTSKSNRRMIKKAIKNNLRFEIMDYNNSNLEKFKVVYNTTMKNLNSIKYYYFNEDYYKNLNNCFLACVFAENILCASCIIFKYKNLLHYHIGGSLLEYRQLGCNNFLHNNVINYGIENNFKLYVLGGGLKDGDSLSKFKTKLSNKVFDYTIYKNILNEEIYEKLSINNKDSDYFPKYRG